MKHICCKSCGEYFQLFADTYQCKCGCSVLQSISPSETIYTDTTIAPDFNPDEEIKNLIEIVMPAIIDRNETENVISAVNTYISDKYENYLSISNLYIGDSIERVLNSSIKQREYDKKQNDFKMRVAMRTYNNKMSEPVNGLGFSIITNDFISAATYLIMAKRNAQKQMEKQEIAAQQNLSYWLNQLSTDNSMYDSDASNLLIAIDESVRLAAMLLDAKRFICAHLDFYADNKHNPGKEINGINIYNFLTGSINHHKFVGGFSVTDEAAEKTVAIMASAGYVYMIGSTNYVTTTKFEQECLHDIYLAEHPEEKAKEEKENELKKDQLYNKALSELENKQYYDAAVDFCAAGDYKDAVARSIEIWNNHLSLDGLIECDLSAICAIHECGSICVATKSDRLAGLSYWKNMSQILLINSLPYGLTEMGTVCALSPNVSNANIQVPGNGTNWKKVLQLAGGSFHLLGLHANGKVSAAGDNEYGECNVMAWNNIVKIAADLNISAGLRADGTVMVAGNPEVCSQSYLNWSNIVDIAVSFYAIVGLQKGGKVKAVGSEPFVEEVTHWENVAKIKAISDCIIGITFDGKILYAGNDELDKAFFDCQKNVVNVFGGEAYSNYWQILHADGTVTTRNVHYDLSGWRDIVFVGGTDEYAYAVQRNGNVLFSGHSRYDGGAFSEITQWQLFNDVNTFNMDKTNIIRQNINKQIVQLQQQLQLCRQELAQASWFAFKRKKELQEYIARLEAILRD